MASKHWVADALAILTESLSPLPHELNELDWKASLSTHKDRLAEHLMAMANQPNGGVLVFGINNDGTAVGVSDRRFRICEERGTGFQKVVQAIELFGMPPLRITPEQTTFSVTLSAPRKFADMETPERIEACYQHAVLQYLSSQTLTNTTLRERFKLHDKQRNAITNLIGEAVAAGRLKRKDTSSGNKFAEYLPYWA